jgi:hypothetical protein
MGVQRFSLDGADCEAKTPIIDNLTRFFGIAGNCVRHCFPRVDPRGGAGIRAAAIAFTAGEYHSNRDSP